MLSADCQSGYRHKYGHQYCITSSRAGNLQGAVIVSCLVQRGMLLWPVVMSTCIGGRRQSHSVGSFAIE
eukprot:5932578-Lingulodinium_polyedra.AAC.1